MKKTIMWMSVFALLVLISCAPGTNQYVGDAVPTAGFFTGFWHGLIIFFTFFASLIWDSVSIYEIHNTGGWYDLGFVLGSGALFASGSSVND